MPIASGYRDPLGLGFGLAPDTGGAPAGHPLAMVQPNAATVDGHPGILRTRPDGSLLWEAELDGDAVASLLRRAMLHGGVRCDALGVAATVRMQGCWYDAAGHTIVVELVGPPTALS
jgi:hypothetical protein